MFIKDLFENGTLASFDLLQKDNNPKSHFFRHLQVRSFAKKHFSFPEAISYICSVNVDPGPVIAVFGILPSEKHFTTLQMNVTAFLMLMARRLILMQWNAVRPASVKHWVKEMLSMTPLEKLKYSCNSNKDRFIKTWTPFIEFIENVSFTWHRSGEPAFAYL